MEGLSCESSRNHDKDDGGERIAAEHLEDEPSPGDVIWVKLHGGSWWPAVVVESNISGDRLMGDIRVRLYGSYEYMYVDPIGWRSEFQITFKQNNGCYQEILRKALEQELSGSKSGKVKRKVSKSKDGVSKACKYDGAKRKLKLDSPNAEKNLKQKTPKQDGIQKKQKLNTPSSDATSFGRSQELSARRTKVMQTLGLIAPSGSPFRKIEQSSIRV